MEIIKHGNTSPDAKSTYVEKYKINCPKCGCIFIADHIDYTKQDKIAGEARIYFNCPECGNEIGVSRIINPDVYEYHAED